MKISIYNILKVNLITALYLLTLLLLCKFSLAQPNLNIEFDRPTVARLINQIDQGQNFPLLKVGYFLGHRNPSFPVDQGIALLEARVEKEPRASKRWLLMQWLRAFGSLRQSEAGRDKALLVYGGIFDAVLLNPSISAPDVVEHIIQDYVFFVPSDYIKGDNGFNDNAEKPLLRALQVYFRLGSPNGKWQPNWVDAVYRTFPEKEVWLDAINAAITNKRVPKNFNFYLSAAQVVRSLNTSRDQKLADKAVELLAKAKPLLPADPAEIERFYIEQTALFQSVNRDKETLFTLRERVAKTGQGQAELLLLLQRTDNKDAEYADVLKDLEKPTAPASEILQAARDLGELKPTTSDDYLEYKGFKTPESRASEHLRLEEVAKSAHADGAALLEAYLSAARSRPRPRAAELQARLMLAQYYLDAQKLDEARRAVSLAGLKVPNADDDDRELWDELSALRRAIEVKR